MLQGSSSLLAHRLQNVCLVILSLAFLPLDTLILFVSLLASKVLPSKANANRKAARRKAGFQKRTVLVTGVGMTKGLALARLFYEAGHEVIGADFEPDGSLVCGRVSSSLRRFYRLQKPDPKSGAAPYIQNLLDVVIKEKVELWISCSGVASAVEDGMAKEVVEARTHCRAIQFDVKATQTLHEKHSFMRQTKSIGLTIPETHEITSRTAVQGLLRRSPPGRKYIMKTIGVDDAVRGDLTLLPKNSDLETAEHIARLKISADSPWILQEFVRGNEYCTHSLALPAESALSRAMLEFTKMYAASGGSDFTGHLSFDFMVRDEDAADPRNIVLYPIECNPRQPADTRVVRPATDDKYYWTGHDLVTLVVLPTSSLLTLSGVSIGDLWHSYTVFLDHLVAWKDGTYTLWDPLPWWWLYHVYWPMRFWGCIRWGKKWSRINVSTAKMFEC
ncbi:hypothetical protein CLAIMM_01167 [Cladophialophora immunda]|nr:hypothetical protein CLAIMM_01167 [Cladophialophora immunda]